MTEIHPDIERLINRALDGALDDDEQVELHRALLRDPEAHRLHDDYRMIDELAASALHADLSRIEARFDPMALTQPPARQRRPLRHHWGWWLLPAAAAAALVFSMIGPKLLSTAPPTNNTIVYRTSPVAPIGNRFVETSQPHAVPRIGNDRFAMPDAQNVGYGTQSIKRFTDRDLLGVMGKDGKVYFLEVDHSRTLTKPKTATERKPAIGDM